MLNLHTKRIVLSHDIIWLNKNYREYVSIKENTKEENYILQYEDESYNWVWVKIDPIKTEVNTENRKTEENINADQDSRGEEDTHKTIKSVSFEKQ